MDDFTRGALAAPIPCGIVLAYALHTLHRLRDQVAGRDEVLWTMANGTPRARARLKIERGSW